MEGPSPARLYALLVGAALTIAGMAGFLYNASFDTGTSVPTDDAFGLLAVNGVHNVLHLATGLAGLAAAGYAARAYALAFGAAYLVLAIWGFVETDGREVAVLLDLLPVNDADNVLHLALGLTGLVAGAASARRGTTPSARRGTTPG